jgi:hypothetical protein
MQRIAIGLMLGCSIIISRPAGADVAIPYNEYSASPTIGRGNGTSTDPNDPGYGAMRIFIQKVMEFTDEHGADALPAGQKVVFQRDQNMGREANALRAGLQYANKGALPRPTVSEPSWGFIYNSVPLGMNFEQMLGFLYTAGPGGRDGIALAQSVLDGRGGTQIVVPVVGSTMQGSGYFPRPIGKPKCHAGDADCEKEANGIGLAGLCTSGWRIRYLSPSEDILSRACDILVQRGAITAKTLTFYPAVGGQSVLLPMQRGTIQGFEFVTPIDDLVDFFPVKSPSSARPLGDPDAGALDCSPAVSFPMPKETKSTCSQNIGQLGARYAHHPAWHQPFVLSWMHVDKDTWNALNPAQQAAIRRAAKDSVVETYKATESIACRKLKDMLDFNEGIAQRNLDGTLRLMDGKPVSARITMAVWPEDALKVLREARDAYLASLQGPHTGERTDAQRDFSTILEAWQRHAASVGADRTFDPGVFPGKTGLAASQTCSLASE